MNQAAVVDIRKLTAMGSLMSALYEHYIVKPATYEYDYNLESLPLELDGLNTGSGEGRSPVKHNREA